MLGKLFIALVWALPVPVAGSSQQRPAGTPTDSINTVELPLASGAAADSLLVDVQTVDTTIDIDPRYATADNFTGAPLPGYHARRVLLRREVARALTRVQSRLRSEGLGLLIFDGYRPVRATLAMVRWAERTGQGHLIAQGYIASRSKHNLGIAVDLTLVSLTERMPLEMGTPFDTFSDASHTANARGQALKHRQILVQAMETQGFRNYDQEWWHFSYPVPGALPFDEVIR